MKQVWQILLLMLATMGLAACSGASSSGESPTQEVIVVVVTATPEATEAITEEEAPSTVQVITMQDLNMRIGDTTDYGVMTIIPGGTSLEVLGINDRGTWYQVSYHDAVGWISAAYADGDVPADLQVVDPPALTSSNGSSSSSSSSGGDSGGDSSSSSSGSGGGGGGSDDSGSGSGSGGGQSAPSDSDISVEVNIKNHTSAHNGVISYPDGDNTDRVYVNVSGFDGATTSGTASFTLTCSGDGVGNVNVNAPSATSGAPGCNSTWTRFFTNDSHNQTITIKLGSGTNAYVNWTLIISANN